MLQGVKNNGSMTTEKISLIIIILVEIIFQLHISWQLQDFVKGSRINSGSRNHSLQSIRKLRKLGANIGIQNIIKRQRSIS